MSKKRHSIPTLEQFETRTLMSAAPVLLADLFSAAQPLGIATTGTVTIDGDLAGGSGDMYHFTMPAKGRMVIDMLGSDSGVDSFLRIYDSQGHAIRGNNNIAGSTDSRLTLGMRLGRSYYLMASSHNGIEGTYRLKVTTVATDDYGNTTDTAKTVTLNSSGAARLSGTINYTGDADMFKLVATQTGKMTVAMNAARRSLLNSELFVYDSQGRLIGQNDNASGTVNSQLTVDVVAGQTYYIKSASHDGSLGQYSLRVSTVIAPPPAPAPDPTPDPTPAPDVPVTPAPGQTVTAQILFSDSKLQLLVLGTDQNDVITLSQTSGGITLITSAGTQNFAGAFTGLVVYGFGGDDTIRLTNTVTTGGWVYGGAGNDSIFNASAGASYIFGDLGNDLLVSVGGGVCTLTGGDGSDSFWTDTADRVADASSAETAIGAVHRIAGFYQPYTTDMTSASYVPTTIAGQNFTDPALASYATGYRNFAGVPLFVDGPQYNDIAQGALGDCYYLASLASLSQSDPRYIQEMIAPLGDGTYAVRFYRSGQSVYLRIDADLPVSSGGGLVYARTGADGELWVPLLEKAYAFFRYNENSYASIEGGWMSDVNTAITNLSNSMRSTTSVSADSLASTFASSLAAGHAVTLGSVSNASGPIVGNHAYMVKSVQTTDAGATVTVYNPWAYDGGTVTDSNYYDGLITLTPDQVQQYFSTAVISLA